MNYLQSREKRLLKKLYTAAIAITCGIAIAPAQAQDATWDGDTSSDWNTASNWNPAAVPTDQAAFDTEGNDRLNLGLSANAGVTGTLFKAGAGNYVISTNAFRLDINGVGITNQSGVQQTFSVNDPSGILRILNSTITGANVQINNTAGQVRFENSSAGSVNILNQTGGVVRFVSSNSQAAQITNSAGSQVIFSGSSVAGTDTVNRTVITNSGAGANIRFQNTADAGTSRIDNNSAGATTDFANSATAGSSIITNSGGTTTFSNNSGADNATITNEDGGSTVFDDNSAAQTAVINNNGGGSVFFNDNATAANATVRNFSGTVDISGTNAPGIGIGSLSGGGNVILGARTLRTGMLNQNDEISGVISGLDGSLTKEGTAILTLSGDNTYTGVTTVSAGTLNLTGKITSSSTTVNANGTLTGNGFLVRPAPGQGNLINNGTVDAGDGSTGDGFGTSSLKVGGDFTNNAGSTVVSRVAGNGTEFADSNAIIGFNDIILNGGEVQANVTSTDPNGFGPNGFGMQTRAIIAGTVDGASTLTGTFDTLDDTNVPTYLDASLDYSVPQSVFLLLERNSSNFVDGLNGLSPNQRNIARALDKSFNNAGPEHFDIYDSVLLSSNPQRNLSLLSGDALTAYPIIAQGASNRFNQQLLLQALQQGRANTQVSSLFRSPRMAYTGTQFRGLLAQADTAPVIVSPSGGSSVDSDNFTRRSNIWATIGRSKENGDSDDNGPGFDARTTDFQVGISRAINPRTVVGISLGKSDGDINVDDRNSEGDLDSTSLGLFARYDADDYYASGLLSYSNHDIDSRRQTGIGTARGDYDARTLALWGEVGKKMQRGGWNVEPNVSLKLSNTKQDEFDESGPGALDVDGNNFNSRRLGLGVRLTKRDENAKVRPHLFLGYEHEFGDETAELNNQFNGLSAFDVESTDLGKNIFTARLGADARLSDRFSLIGEIGASWRKNQDSQYIYGGMKYGF